MDLLSNMKEVVVVEGYHDLSKIKSIFPNIDVVITNGSEISETTLQELKKLNEIRGLILFLDPDFQGERIRSIINDFVGDTKHVYIKKELAISKNRSKVGVEHATKEDIIEAFKNIKESKNIQSNITIKTLYTYDLVGSINSKKRRKYLCETIGIGLSNGKTLVKKLNMFGITETEVAAIMRK